MAGKKWYIKRTRLGLRIRRSRISKDYGMVTEAMGGVDWQVHRAVVEKWPGITVVVFNSRAEAKKVIRHSRNWRKAIREGKDSA